MKGQFMDAYGRLRASALSMIVRDVAAAFWPELRALSMVTYADAFAEVAADKGTLEDQKIDDLLQRRHFKMERLIVDLAKKHGLAHTLSVIVQNNRRHAYVYTGDVGMTQSYVKSIGSMPQPARFRERFANAMSIPRLDLGDEPDGAFIMRNLYGVIAHNPIGRRFNETEQKLGMIQFCVPAIDCKAWGVELTLSEIIDSYPAAAERETPKRSLPWKKKARDEGTGTEGK
ncbi:hypothetical protein [Methylocystis heyeri]|uniref:Uncharacterized protein n=1 Tax=Methylocystis heyeri TaxID=391905 RepID=A0A6B8KFX7_9HYPH|nr:hypothetical protein [Methylocystis heyeri]QGM46509.1 hypothetical protein H2LOC_012835 [Methylocystis heyeri]